MIVRDAIVLELSDSRTVELTRAEALELALELAAMFPAARARRADFGGLRSWTKEQVEVARQRREEGRSHAEIADELGKTRGAVEQMFHRLRKGGVA